MPAGSSCDCVSGPDMDMSAARGIDLGPTGDQGPANRADPFFDGRACKRPEANLDRRGPAE
jgi:hypothetical protein